MASSKVCTLARSRRPVYACERQQGAGLQVGGLVVVDEHAGELVEVEQGDGHAGAFRLVERLLGEAAGAHVQTLVGVVFCQIFVGRFGVSFSPFERLFLGRFGFGQSCGLSVIA